MAIRPSVRCFGHQVDFIPEHRARASPSSLGPSSQPARQAASQADPWWPGWPGSSRVFPAVTGSGPYFRIQEISLLCPQGRAWHSKLCDSPPAPSGANAGGSSRLLPSCLSAFPLMAPACCWDSRTAGLDIRGLSLPFSPLPQPPHQGHTCFTTLGFILLHFVSVRATIFICTNLRRCIFQYVCTRRQ